MNNFLILSIVSVLFLSSIGISNTSFAQLPDQALDKAKEAVPDWIKSNAGWWADGLIDDADFLQGIGYLIQNDVLVIPETQQGESSGTGIPPWVKTTAKWWSEGNIGDDDFVSGIQFLVKEGIMSTEPESEIISIEEDENVVYDVIIIGAGMAGVAAADQLNSQGFDVVILEAKDRVGGRIWTFEWGDTDKPVDLGASWIHGTTGNPITKIADDNGIEYIETHLDERVVLGSDGEWLTEEELEEIDAMYREFLDFRWEYAETVNSDTSVRAAETVFGTMKNLSDEEKDQLRFIINADLEHEEAADTKDISLWVDVGEPFGGKEVIFPGGYKQILDTLTDGLDIRLEHVVTDVEYDSNGVTVTTNQGTFDGKYVVSTLPIGVLKAGSVEFSPVLPSDKQQAIDHIGMGLMNKLYLLFPEEFWDDVTLLNYVSSENDSMWEFLNLSELGEPILLSFTIGDHARDLEKVSDAQIIDEAMDVLRSMYGDDIPEPEDYIRTKWASDPFAMGAYSFSAIGTTEADYAAISSPVMNRVFFAGEGTIADHTATVHGAYLSGLRAADQISDAEN